MEVKMPYIKRMGLGGIMLEVIMVGCFWLLLADFKIGMVMGTIVTASVIISRLPLYNNEGTIGYFDYAACVYPTGQADQQVHFFNEEDIAEVFFEGYRDELEEKFCEKYQEMVDQIPYPRLHIVYDEEWECRRGSLIP